MLTNQQLFNNTWYWHIVNNNPQSSENGNCLYRTSSGNRCSIGASIPDDEYDPKLDNSDDITFSSIDCIELPICLQGIDMEFAKELQITHDYFYDDFNKDYKNNLIKIAQKYGLEIPE